MMVYATVPSTTASSAPVTVTVCGVSAFAGVKVRDEGDGVPSPGRDDERLMVTLAEGVDLRTTVNVAVPPDSDVTRPDVGETMISAASLSRLVTATSGGFTPL